MATIADARDAWMEAEEEAAATLEEFLSEWQEPDQRLQVTVAAKITPPEALDLLGEADRQVIEEVQRG